MKRVGVFFDDRKIVRLGLDKKFDSSDCSSFQYVKIDPNIALELQGPFDLVLHKLSDFRASDFSLFQKLEKFLSDNPKVLCLDPIHSVRTLANRFEQCRLVASSLSKSRFSETFRVPPFCLLNSDRPKEMVANMDEHGLQFPIICKPLLAPDGGASRQMALVFNQTGLERLTSTPTVAQQFVNHNSRLFKVFVVGDYVCIRPRPSIRNLYPSNDPTIFFVSTTISKENSQSPLTTTDLDEQSRGQEQLAPEESRMLERIAQVLRSDLNVDLFGFDVIHCAQEQVPGEDGDIVDEKHPTRFAVIDVNSVPGYQNVPNFLEHLENLIRQKLALATVPAP